MKTNEKLNLTMLCDFYELTMGNGYFRAGLQDRITYFDVFFRNVPDNGGKVTGFVNRFEGNTYDVVLFLKGTDLRKFELWFQDWDGSNPCEHRFDEISVYETDFTF